MGVNSSGKEGVFQRVGGGLMFRCLGGFGLVRPCLDPAALNGCC